MASTIKQFQFRDAESRKKLEALGLDADLFAQLMLQHATEQVSEGVCPVCKKPFDDCEYFQRLESE